MLWFPGVLLSYQWVKQMDSPQFEHRTIRKLSKKNSIFLCLLYVRFVIINIKMTYSTNPRTVYPIFFGHFI